MNSPDKQLLIAAKSVLQQLCTLARQLTAQQYAQPLELLHGNTIGRHYRHIIEFYQCLVNNKGVINYDKRLRSLSLENNVSDAIEALTALSAEIETLDTGAVCRYETDFSDTGNEPQEMQTGIAREIAYNIEHAVHHMAIIQIAVTHQYKDITIENGFGVAASTRRHLQQIPCAQ